MKTEDDALIAEAEKRLALSKSTHGTIVSQRLKREYGFGDEVELALRMLPKNKLQDVLVAEKDFKWKLSEVPDKNKFMLTFISKLDPRIELLVRRLVDMDTADKKAQQQEHVRSTVASTTAASTKGASTTALNSSKFADPVAEAERRLTAYRVPANIAAISKLKAELGFTDQAELALRMLAPTQLKELLAGAVDIRRKLQQTTDTADDLVMWLVSQLDPNVKDLVRKLQGIDTEPEAKGSDPVQEAERRLSEFKSPDRVNSIASLKDTHSLSDEVELALRLLSPANFEELRAALPDLELKLAQVSDKDQLLLNLISELEPEASDLVKKLNQIDSKEPAAQVKPPARQLAALARGTARPAVRPPVKALRPPLTVKPTPAAKVVARPVVARSRSPPKVAASGTAAAAAAAAASGVGPPGHVPRGAAAAVRLAQLRQQISARFRPTA